MQKPKLRWSLTQLNLNLSIYSLMFSCSTDCLASREIKYFTNFYIFRCFQIMHASAAVCLNLYSVNTVHKHKIFHGFSKYMQYTSVRQLQVLCFCFAHLLHSIRRHSCKPYSQKNFSLLLSTGDCRFSTYISCECLHLRGFINLLNSSWTHQFRFRIFWKAYMKQSDYKPHSTEISDI